jgi:hypothetical protein
MNDVELMEKIKNIQGLLWRPFVDELLIRSKKWFKDQEEAADRIEQLEAKLSKVVNAARAYRIATTHLRPCPETSDGLDAVLAELEEIK